MKGIDLNCIIADIEHGMIIQIIIKKIRHILI